MKAFFQGLVIGAAVMYWYLNYSTPFIAQMQHWLDSVGGLYRDDPSHEKAEEALHGFLLWRDRRLPAEEERVAG